MAGTFVTSTSANGFIAEYGGNLYIGARPVVSGDGGIFKSTNGGTSWSQMDQANQPTDVIAALYYSWLPTNQYIYLFYAYDAAGAPEYLKIARFNMATDTWDTAFTTTDTIDCGYTNTILPFLLSDGSFTILYDYNGDGTSVRLARYPWAASHQEIFAGDLTSAYLESDSSLHVVVNTAYQAYKYLRVNPTNGLVYENTALPADTYSIIKAINGYVHIIRKTSPANDWNKTTDTLTPLPTGNGYTTPFWFTVNGNTALAWIETQGTNVDRIMYSVYSSGTWGAAVVGRDELNFPSNNTPAASQYIHWLYAKQLANGDIAFVYGLEKDGLCVTYFAIASENSGDIGLIIADSINLFDDFLIAYLQQSISELSVSDSLSFSDAISIRLPQGDTDQEEVTENPDFNSASIYGDCPTGQFVSPTDAETTIENCHRQFFVVTNL